MTVERVPEDALIAAYDSAQAELRDAEFPRLVVDEVIDDGETYLAVRCPRCGELVDEGELVAVSPAESWDYNDEIEPEDARVVFNQNGSPDLGETLYYLHGDNPGHAVSLPDGWTEDWT